jgi:Flp pilus assembly CpaF family ATPase
VAYVLDNPLAQPDAIAAHFKQRPAWFMMVLASDKFQRALDPYREQVANPMYTATMEERLRALALKGMDVIQTRLESKEVSDLLVLKATEIGIKGLGLGQPKDDAEKPVGTVESLAERLVTALNRQRSNVRVADGRDSAHVTVEAEIVRVPNGG